MENMVTMFEKLKSTYQGKRVFLTGHTGFKGAWMTALLNAMGAEVKGFALAPEYEGCIYSLLEKELDVDSVIADIRDKQRLINEILFFQPDYIFHLAAQPLVRRSYAIPAETFEINVIGTANILEALIHLNKPCAVVVITTDKVYENKEKNLLYNEADVLGGYDPYSASKACTELLVNSFRNSFFNVAEYNVHHKAVASARAGNVIGGGDFSENRIIPDIVRALTAQEVIAVRNPSSVRPWQHVLEPISGYLLLGALLNENPVKYGKAYNFGPQPQDHLTVKELVELAISAWGKGEWKDNSDTNQPHEGHLLQLDIALAAQELQWLPKLDSKQAIAWTIDWYKKSLPEKVTFTFEQINSYLNL
ncbi:CDP-glucose 4,6-dehydratase [Chitinophaga sancti]|uniref:CDP-glucose 4,6-dehydratase n=1 Tax=Chitinophaga sancti TaxID=1004 RepID=UPI002A74AD24|nr:CDP-glucose 4,6-dehydratase [Chitinophaga sancti]WPQ64519.1 CDP-glucose 4,6-dehydratase [Chitinophaga sancti]